MSDQGERMCHEVQASKQGGVNGPQTESQAREELPDRDATEVKHWHLCRRWTDRGITCPFRLLEMTEEREEPDLEPDKRDRPQVQRHAALAEVGVPVGVISDERTIKNWHGYADAGRALQNTGVVDAVTKLVVPPFEAPIETPASVVPNYVGGQEGLHGNSDQVTQAIGTPIPANVVDARDVERVLAETLSRAGERGVGARQSASTDAALLEQQEREGVARAKIQQTPFRTPNPIAEALRLELWAAAAMAYGVIESFKAIRNARIKRPAADTGRITVPKPILQSTPPGGARPRSVGSGGSSGDIPGMLREFRAGLNLKDNP